MKKESDQPELPLAWPVPAFRSLTFQESAENNMPMQRFVPATKPLLPSTESGQLQMPPTSQFGIAPHGTTRSEKK